MRINNILTKLILEKWRPKNKKKHAACKAKVKARVEDWPSAYASGQVVQCYYGKDLKESTMKNLFKLFEKQMTPIEKQKRKKLHKKISKAPFIRQYGKEKGEQIYYGTTTKMAMESNDCGCGDDVLTEAKKKSNLDIARKIINKTRSQGERNVRKANKAEKTKKTKKRGSPWFIDKETRNANPHTSRKKIPRNHPNRTYMTSAQVAKRRQIFDALVKKAKAEGKSLSGPAGSPAANLKQKLAATATKRAIDTA